MKLTLALTASLALASCAAKTDHPIVENGPPMARGPVELDQPVTVGTLVATPKKVVEDSRCPMNARCVWAGRVILSTKIDGAGWRETVDLTLGESHTTHGTSITLVSVAPARMAGTETGPLDYRFDFEGGN